MNEIIDILNDDLIKFDLYVNGITDNMIKSEINMVKYLKTIGINFNLSDSEKEIYLKNLKMKVFNDN